MATNVALVGLARALNERQKQQKPIRIGLVGCGEMGTDLIASVALMEGITIGAIATRRPQRVLEAAEKVYQNKGHALEVANMSAMNAAIQRGVIAATGDLDLMLKCELIDVVVDATGHPEAGAEIGFKAISNHKHLVMMNVEADVTIGPFLKHEADKNGVIYSLGAGDEPSSCMELIEFVSALGHRIVAAGKGKNNPLIVDAVPRDYEDEAHRRGMNVRMLVEFIDGSKTMVEMTAIANATGLIPDQPGMHGPAASLRNLSQVLIPKDEGGILSRSGVVDYSIASDVSPGVFVVAEVRDPRVRERMEDLKIGKGPYFTFHRPFHLTAMEVPLTCARVVLYGRPDMVPLSRPVAEVCALAKRDLIPGDTLDFIGLYTYRAWAMSTGDARSARAIPCGLLEGAAVIAPIKKNELITESNVRIKPDTWIAKLRRAQDQLLATA